MLQQMSNQKMLQDAQGVERCRRCAEEMHLLLTKERQHIESNILELSREHGYLESHINVLELQGCRPPSRQVQLPEQVLQMRKKVVAAMKVQSQLLTYIMKYYTHMQIEMVSGGILAAGNWQYDKDIEVHKDWMLSLQ